MPVHVGIDLVSVERIRDSVARHGERFLDRVYTPAERAASAGSPSQLAARFAAKEATMKALGRDEEGLAWRAIEVVEGEHGRCWLRLTDGAAVLAAARGVTNLSLSLTRQRDRAAAIVVAEANL
jgi:holo-[acyl-carrier protein] synthase